MIPQIDSFLSNTIDNSIPWMNTLICSIPVLNNRMLKIFEDAYSKKINTIHHESKKDEQRIAKANEFKAQSVRCYELGSCVQSAIAIAAFAVILFAQPLGWGSYVFFGCTFVIFGASAHDAFIKHSSSHMRFQH